MALKIKRQWLVSSLFYFVFLLLSCLPIDPYFTFEFTLELGLISKTLLIPFGYLVIESLNFLGLFFFSYKKEGTALLTLNMLLSVFRMYAAAVALWHLKEISEAAHFILIFSILLSLQWCIFSFKLRRENQLLKVNKRILADPELEQAIQDLQRIDNLKELSNSYNNSIRTYPEIHKMLKKVYAQRKLDLSITPILK
jgi:hypothetical protein